MRSISGANSRFESPGLQSPYSFGRNQFQIPSSRAFAFKSSNQGGYCQALLWSSTHSQYSSSRGKMCSSMKRSTRASSSRTRSLF